MGNILSQDGVETMNNSGIETPSRDVVGNNYARGTKKNDSQYGQIHIVHPRRQSVCFIEHPMSQTYLQVTETGAQFATLDNENSAKFERSIFGGLSRSTRQRLVLMVFRVCTRGMLYLSTVKSGLEEIQDSFGSHYDTIDGSMDNRTFIHEYVTSSISIFESIKRPGCYLSKNGKYLELKNVSDMNVYSDSDIQFRIRYPSLMSY